MLKKLFVALCLSALVLCTSALAQVQVEDTTIQMGSNTVSYPQLSGMADETLQTIINSDLLLSSGVSEHMVTLATLAGGAGSLQVNYDVQLLTDDVFSVVISAKGRIPGHRDGHAYTALTYDLSNGSRITLDDVFIDPDEAAARMEQLAEETLSDELNGYMEYSDITPLPRESFTLSETGITFWYPSDQFSLLSGYSGACQFWYCELDGLWNEQFHADAQLTNAEAKQRIISDVEAGVFPHVPAVMGQPLQEVLDAGRLLRTPDEFPGGRYYVLEAPSFRQILVISDSLSSDYSQSVVEGIQLKRGGLHGMLIGHSKQSSWRDVLGEPEETIVFTESMAYDYHLPAGECDVYHFGKHELRLHADENGVLCAIQMCY